MPATIRKRASPLLIDYCAPFDWPSILDYFTARATPGVEVVHGGQYWRTVRIDEHVGVVTVSDDPLRSALRVAHSPSLAPTRPKLIGLVRRLFDPDTTTDPIVRHLARDARLSALVRRRPGLRVPGAATGFELAVRAILGQQVSVRGASTLAGRLASLLGEPLASTFDAPREVSGRLTHVAVTPERLADAGVERVAGIGLPRARAATLVHLADAVAEGTLGDLDPGPGAEEVAEQLLSLPGIGPWTAQYVALRALRIADAFPDSDLGLRKAMGGVSAIELRCAAERWRPWRGYAAIHLWTALSSRPNEPGWRTLEER